MFPVEEVARHRIARAGDIALREHDLEKVRLRHRRAEHLGAAIEVDPPDAPEALVEALRVDRPDPVPVAVEAPRPAVERDPLLPPHLPDLDHFHAPPLPPPD